MIRNKRTIMAFAGLQILFYHLWVNLFPGNTVTLFVKRIAFTGVDLFFLISAWSLAFGKITDLTSYLKSRFVYVYLKYVLFAIAACMFGSMTLPVLFKSVTGISLWQKGGGSFLWFLPAIMMLYLAVPFLQKAMEADAVFTILVLTVVWFVVGYVVSKYTVYSAMFIFWNRIPVFLLGYVCGFSDRIGKLVSKRSFCFSAGVLLIGIGILLAIYCIDPVLLQKPLRDFFYVGMIPLTMGMCLILSCIPEGKVISAIGSSTLEMYGIQMVFGYMFANKMLVWTDNALITNVCTVLFVLGTSILLSELYRKCAGFIGKKKRC